MRTRWCSAWWTKYRVNTNRERFQSRPNLSSSVIFNPDWANRVFGLDDRLSGEFNPSSSSEAGLQTSLELNQTELEFFSTFVNFPWILSRQRSPASVRSLKSAWKPASPTRVLSTIQYPPENTCPMTVWLKWRRKKVQSKTEPMAICLNNLKSEIKTVERLFHKNHELFQIVNASVDELTCRFISKNGKKYDIHANITVSPFLIFFPLSISCSRKSLHTLSLARSGSQPTFSIASLSSTSRMCDVLGRTRSRAAARVAGPKGLIVFLSISFGGVEKAKHTREGLALSQTKVAHTAQRREEMMKKTEREILCVLCRKKKKNLVDEEVHTYSTRTLSKLTSVRKSQFCCFGKMKDVNSILISFLFLVRFVRSLNSLALRWKVPEVVQLLSVLQQPPQNGCRENEQRTNWSNFPPFVPPPPSLTLSVSNAHSHHFHYSSHSYLNAWKGWRLIMGVGGLSDEDGKSAH